VCSYTAIRRSLLGLQSRPTRMHDLVTQSMSEVRTPSMSLCSVNATCTCCFLVSADNPETGIIFLNVARTQELVWLARNAYSNTRYQALIGGVNDVQVFGFLLARMVDVGWFAVGCRSSVSADRKASRSWLADSVAYDPHGYQYCPSEASSKSQVSPFNLLEYITHLKNHSGPTGRQLPGIHGAGMASHFCLLAGRNRSLMCNRG